MKKDQLFGGLNLGDLAVRHIELGVHDNSANHVLVFIYIFI